MYEDSIVKRFSVEETVRYKYPNAGAGLHKIYIAQIGILVCTIAAVVPLINLLAAIGVVAFCVYYMVGMFQAGKDIGGCRTAAILQVAVVLCSIVQGFVELPLAVSGGLEILDSIIGLVIVYLICRSVSKVMEEIRAFSVAEQGRRTWWIYLGCSIGILVVGVLAAITLVFVLRGAGGATGWLLVFEIIAVLAAAITQLTVYLGFLKNSAAQLGAY